MNPKLRFIACPHHNHVAMIGPRLAPAQEPTTMATSPSATKTAANPLLHILKATLVASVRSDQTDLSARQLTVFLKVYLEPDTEHTVRGLAADLNISKPAITRAIDRLEENGFAKRETDSKDRRSIIVRRTPTGSTYLGTLNGYLNAASKAADKLANK
jgi:DNA-binding MarR family transcriptional regulator